MLHETIIREKAQAIRASIVTMLAAAGSGHSAGPLGMADVFATLYFGEVLRHKAEEPEWEDRDKLVLSCGHICPVLYATLAEAGYFPKEELLTLRKLDSRLQGHPHNLALPGIETSSGPLSQGISQAIGMALANRLDERRSHVYAILSDGEHNEGQIWEGVMFAGNAGLSNLTVIIDRNNIQIDGPTEQIMPLEPLADKYRAFNWHVREVDGHNVRAIWDACMEARAITDGPTVIIAHTIPGKGVDFMEYDYRWHGKPPTAEQAAVALTQIMSEEV